MNRPVVRLPGVLAALTMSCFYTGVAPDDRVETSSEKLLINHLLERYSRVGRYGRPVRNTSLPVVVQFGLGLINLELDERLKVLRMSMWAKYKWTDQYLVWEPQQFGNISDIRLECSLIWIPDIMLYNTADTEAQLRSTLATIYSNGSVSWTSHQVFRSSCSIDVTNFPFDTQNCHMWFGSWTHSVRYLDLAMVFEDGIDIGTFQADYKDSSEWTIEGVIGEKQVLPEMDEPKFAVLQFTLVLNRKQVFASYILTLPCVFLACLTLVVFWIPPERPDRTSLGM